jgi:hypothetical protein
VSRIIVPALLRAGMNAGIGSDLSKSIRKSPDPAGMLDKVRLKRYCGAFFFGNKRLTGRRPDHRFARWQMPKNKRKIKKANHGKRPTAQHQHSKLRKKKEKLRI